MRRSKKLWIAAAFILAGAMIARFAWAVIEDPISTVLIVLGAILFLFGVFYFAANFKE